MRTLFIGGPGRSGTSFVAQSLGRHPQICAFPDIELKLFTEKNGLLDLCHSLVEEYSPNRAAVALAQFQRLTEALVQGQYGQPKLASLRPAGIWTDIFEEFRNLLAPTGHPCRLDEDAFLAAARVLLGRLVDVAADIKNGGTPPAIFLEKTPHALLSIQFLERLSPGSIYLHVMRDPRAIALSLQRMRWAPDQIEACCAWVASYCDAWRRVQDTIVDSGLVLEQVRIEDIARAPQEHTTRICRALGIETHHHLLDQVQPATLESWKKKSQPHERGLAQQLLSGWAWEFGYREPLAKIGGLSEVTSSASPGQ